MSKLLVANEIGNLIEIDGEYFTSLLVGIKIFPEPEVECQFSLKDDSISKFELIPKFNDKGFPTLEKIIIVKRGLYNRLKSAPNPFNPEKIIEDYLLWYKQGISIA